MVPLQGNTAPGILLGMTAFARTLFVLFVACACSDRRGGWCDDTAVTALSGLCRPVALRAHLAMTQQVLR